MEFLLPFLTISNDVPSLNFLKKEFVVSLDRQLSRTVTSRTKTTKYRTEMQLVGRNYTSLLLNRQVLDRFLK